MEAVESRAQDGDLKGAEIFLFTDNTTAEGAFYKGTSSNKRLFELVRRLRKIEMHEGCKLQVVHVAGSRMILQGTDGLSRGDTGEGVMGGANMLSYVPLHLTALERSLSLKGWLENHFNIAGLKKVQILSPEGWFDKGYDIVGGEYNLDGVWMPRVTNGRYLWVPPPAGGLAAIEQLRRARLKRQQSTHIFLIPRLFTSIWRKQLRRVADLTLELPFMPGIWEQSSQHEPLTIAFIFPYINRKPWQLKRTPAFLGMDRLLRGMWKEDTQSVGALLCKLCTRA